MTERAYTDDGLIAGYLACATEEPGGPHFWAFEEVTQMVGSAPERAWRLTIEMVRQAKDDLVLSCVAAGPLEDLLAHYGPSFIDRTEQLIGSEPRFRDALCMVYSIRFKPDVRARVERAMADA